MNSKSIFNPQFNDKVPEISPDQLKPHIDHVTMIDVRQPDEYVGELSHIPGARLITLGTDLDSFLQSHDKDDEVVFVCRSGARSGRATVQARALGFTKSVNLQGGMILWNKLQFPVEGKK